MHLLTNNTDFAELFNPTTSAPLMVGVCFEDRWPG
jgi:hypothetical protein